MLNAVMNSLGLGYGSPKVTLCGSLANSQDIAKANSNAFGDIGFYKALLGCGTINPVAMLFSMAPIFIKGDVSL